MTWTAHTTCRACESETLVPYLDLGVQALANALVPADGGPEVTVPLSVSWCSACGLSQLDQVVDPEILYADYPFRAGTSQAWRDHCAALVTSAHTNSKHPFLIDIGSNDGTLLEAAQAKGWKVLGVDPSDTGNPKIPMLERFWTAETAKQITKAFRQADLITATNVLGHVDDAADFLYGVALALAPGGIAIIECPHIIPFLEDVAFDTIYHEHLTYWSLRPLEMLAESVGLRVVDCKMFPELHGGTMRYVLTPGDVRTKIKTSVTGLRILESALFQQGIAPYEEFARKARANISVFREALRPMAGQRVWGYGASAKGAVLLQAAGISDVTMERIVDDTEEKWGRRLPGSLIPITSAADLSEPDVLVLLSWNNAPALKAKARKAGFRGKFLVPVPHPHFEAA